VTKERLGTETDGSTGSGQNEEGSPQAPENRGGPDRLRNPAEIAAS